MFKQQETIIEKVMLLALWNKFKIAYFGFVKWHCLKKYKVPKIASSQPQILDFFNPICMQQYIIPLSLPISKRFKTEYMLSILYSKSMYYMSYYKNNILS